jgi:hypothetical protein
MEKLTVVELRKLFEDAKDLLTPEGDVRESLYVFTTMAQGFFEYLEEKFEILYRNENAKTE